ncbi:RNA-directed DNA polymerase, eukaryota [Tanacetum coccineum]|uniref:RNA-directed DNA polymerase, eukaryota n=1 Tax=Tanacetum coccineum TaxID=301880 RepID=A0ABQ4WBT0_9ASTR
MRGLSWLRAWKGKNEDVLLDFNVVRRNDDRFNSQVNKKEMMEFNDFINAMRFSDLWGNLSVVALDRKLSDHCPIVIKDVELDFGPKPFRIFNIWMEEPNFTRVMEEA